MRDVSPGATLADEHRMFLPAGMVARSELKERAMTLGNEINVVTGAFSYSGQYIARRLLARGKEVRTLTGHPQRAHPLSNQVRAFPLAFDDLRLLREALRGARVLYNTYWIRFPYGLQSYE